MESYPNYIYYPCSSVQYSIVSELIDKIENITKIAYFTSGELEQYDKKSHLIDFRSIKLFFEDTDRFYNSYDIVVGRALSLKGNNYSLIHYKTYEECVNFLYNYMINKIYDLDLKIFRLYSITPDSYDFKFFDFKTNER